jgi:hypothetical protein
MNTETPPAIAKSERRLARWLLLGLAVMIAPVLALGLGIASMLSLDSDAALLRREVSAATDSHWHSKVQVSVGWVTLGLLRTGLRFVEHEHMDEARLALSAVRRASVGVYERTGRAGDWSREKLLSHTDRVMRNRGWSRLVGVAEEGQAVLVYASDEIDSSNRLEVCVAVVDDDNLVVVSTRVDADAIAKLAEMKMPPGEWRTKLAKI